MKELIDLYKEAEAWGIDVDWFTMQEAVSLSAQLPDGTLCIALDPWKIDSLTGETVVLAHELGHCRTGSLYDQHATCDIREKHENRADKWAIDHLIGREAFGCAVASGHTELWELAEYFGVPEEFMRKAVCWYTQGNLAVEYYAPNRKNTNGSDF